MKFICIFLALISVAHSEVSSKSWDGRIFNVKTKIEITEEEYVHDLASFTTIVLGEKHYTPAVQLAQAKTIRSLVTATGRAGEFTTGWEFLNVTSQSLTDDLFNKVKTKVISAENFLDETQGKTPSMSYAPIINVTADLGGKILGMNLSRAEKAPVTEKGIEALDPQLLPPGFDYGTAGYFERFKEVMQGHATPEQVKNYYASQCLVDDVIAYHLLGNAEPLKFLIVGSFHSDFFDGAVNRMKVRDPHLLIATVKIIDSSDFSENELLAELHDNKYGDIADYVYFVNNPKENLANLTNSRGLTKNIQLRNDFLR
jgi:uncharacterized iron-regulated protein